MPLIKGKSPKSFDHNVEAEMDSGKPQNQALAIAYAMKRKARKMAQGGFIGSHQTAEHEEDMIDRIMRKRYSEGGMIANENSGSSASIPDDMAKDNPNEFDDLALRDDLAFEYTGANSGDELGSKLNQSDEGEDMIDRVMRKRAMNR